MATYAQLEAESWWLAETVAPAHQAFNNRMMAAYDLTPATCGSKGDNNHLYGRHRSRDWDLNSRFCTDRTYGTQDARDRAGAGNLIRATDTGIAGAVHWAAAHRLDQAVRAGQLPAVAEWFGTFDGKTVVGWYEGHPSSADDSHLTHLHVGLWTGSCNDTAQLQLLGDIILGDTGGLDMFIAHIPKTFYGNPEDEYWMVGPAGRYRVVVDAAQLRGIFARGGCPTVQIGAADVPASKAWSPARVVAELGPIVAAPAAGSSTPVAVDAAAVAAALTGDAAFLKAIGVAVLDEQHLRDAE